VVTFVNPDRIDYQVTIEDPKVFARPWKMAWNLGRDEEQEQWESAIWEGSRAAEVIFGAPVKLRRSPW
jgi:hypothetical protein